MIEAIPMRSIGMKKKGGNEILKGSNAEERRTFL